MFGKLQVYCQTLGSVVVWHTQLQILCVYVLMGARGKMLLSRAVRAAAIVSFWWKGVVGMRRKGKCLCVCLPLQAHSSSQGISHWRQDRKICWCFPWWLLLLITFREASAGKSNYLCNPNQISWSSFYGNMNNIVPVSLRSISQFS